jgi:molecular chaperone DnaK (HSP70)
MVFFICESEKRNRCRTISNYSRCILNETEVEDMLAEMKNASMDKEKRENIDLKNQAETLCFEAEKLSLKLYLKEKNNKKTLKLIEEIRDIQSDDLVH